MISVLIPAHNEESTIEKTLLSIFNQTLVPDKVVVICDNCTDKTLDIVQRMKYNFGEKLITFETINNTGRKAGALNQAFKILNIEEEEFVLVMDADTEIHCSAIEAGTAILQKDENIGAVCSRAGVLPCREKSKWKNFIWTLQHLEYADFDAHRIETQGNIKVAHGMATMFRMKALYSVSSYRKEHFQIESGVYLEDNLVEDYELTLCLKNSWKLTSSLNMLAWTDVPLSVKELWIQRLRWLRGGVDCLRTHGWNKVTKIEILNHLLFVFIIFLQAIVSFFTLRYIIFHGFKEFHYSYLVACVLIGAYLDSLYRLKYVQDKTIWDYIVRIVIIPEMLYGCFQAIIMILSYIKSYCNIKQKW
ncbi:MAG TPA: glycosyltransferase family 2 protein [Clostridia bacterium]